MEDELTGNGVTTFHGDARFTGPNQLEIDGTQHRAKRFLERSRFSYRRFGGGVTG